MRKYFIYDNDQLVMSGYSPEIKNKLPFGYNTLYKYALSGQKVKGRWSIKYEEHKEVPNNCIKVVEEDPPEVKDAKALKIIKECLEEFGNTNLVRWELKFLPELKKEYRLQIQAYKPNKTLLPMAGVDDDYCEDWIITWLDWSGECIKQY